MAVDIDFQKKVNIINFFAKNSPKKTIGKIDLLKAVFFADRYHLLKYCRTVSDDTYYAMKHGPVASAIKNICNLERLSKDEIEYAEKFLLFGKNTIHSRPESVYDASLFSESDLEALNESLLLLRSLKKQGIKPADYSHRFFDWDNKYAPFLPLKEDNRVNIDLDEFFNITDDDYCSKIDPELRNLNREMIQVC